MSPFSLLSFVAGFLLSPVVLVCLVVGILRYDRWKAAKEDR